MKKILLFIISLTMVFSLSISYSFANTSEPTDYDTSTRQYEPFKTFTNNTYTKIQRNILTFESLCDIENQFENSSNQAVFYHNNGLPIETSGIISLDDNENLLSNEEYAADDKKLAADCEKEGYDYINDGEDDVPDNVFGIYFYKTPQGILGEILVTANSKSMTPAEISEGIDSGLENAYEKYEKDDISVNTDASKKTALKSISKTCKDGDTKVATITGTVTLLRQSKNATIDKEKCSLWDVGMFVQVECVNKRKVISEYTWLNTNQTNQKLVQYGPVGDKGKSDGYSFSFSVGGFASASFDAVFGGSYKRQDMTTLSGKYGKWKVYTDTTAMKSSLTTHPAIRCSNTKGNFVSKAKLQVKLMHLVGRTYHSKTFTWGTKTFTLTDR